MFEIFFFWLGILGIVHSLNTIVRFIRGYTGKKPDIKKKYNTNWVLITGASSGTGKHLALKLAKDGLNIVGTGRDTTRLNSVAQQCRSLGVQFETVIADFAKPESVNTVVKAMEDKDIGVYFLCAGYGMVDDFFNFTEKQLIDFIESMVISQTILYKYIIEKSKKRKSETLVYGIASLAAEAIFGTGQMYCTVKSYMSSMFRHLELEMRNEAPNIHFQAIHPGPFAGSMFFNKVPQFVQNFIEKTQKFLLKDEDIADMMLYTMGNGIQVDVSSASLFSLFGYWLITKVGQNLVNRFFVWAKMHMK